MMWKPIGLSCDCCGIILDTPGNRAYRHQSMSMARPTQNLFRVASAPCVSAVERGTAARQKLPTACWSMMLASTRLREMLRVYSGLVARMRELGSCVISDLPNMQDL